MYEIKVIRAFVTIVMCMLAGACAAPGSMERDPASMHPASAIPPAEVNGASFNNGAEVRLFEDLKAGRIGDILTVRLVEQTSASKSSATSTSKSTEATLANPTVFGRPITKDGVPLFDGSLSGDSPFDGAGSSSQSNSLTGSITVTVSQVLRNGSLRVRGEKWVTINQGDEFIRIQGIVRPEDIAADNSVPSFKVADARITYSGKGALADANSMGWLGRLFQSVLSPF